MPTENISQQEDLTPTHPAKAAPDSRHDLTGKSAVDKIRELIKQSDTCFMVTHGGVRPMGVRECDDSGVIWFLSDKHSNKNAQIAANDEVELYFQA